MGLFSFVGNLINDVTGASSSAKNTYQNNVDLWNMQNAYNTPSAQIARMKDAGIDVNPMTYAVGNGSMDTTASSVSPGNYSSAGNPVSMLMSVIQGLQGVKNQKAQELSTDANTAYTEAQTAALRHNISYANKQGLPVGQIPTWDKIVGEHVNTGVQSLKDNGFRGTVKGFWNWLTK